MKPTSAFKRRPRSIFEISKFKASELFNLLWFYLRYSLVGLLPTRITKHMEKLSAATFILCQKQTNVEQISTACEMLQQFAKEFEQIYGRGAVTMNIHLLHHYHKMILNCGPLWSYNLFAFENNIGVLKNFISGTTDVLYQIAIKYSKSRENGTIKPMNEQLISVKLYEPITMIVNEQYFKIFKENKFKSGAKLQIWRKAKINDVIYATRSGRQTQSINYFVELINGYYYFYLLYLFSSSAVVE